MTHKPCRFLGEKHRAFQAKAFLFPLVFLQESHHSLSFFQMNSRHTHFPQLSGPRRQELAFEPTARPGGTSASEWRGKTGHAIPRGEILIEEKIQAMVNFVKIGHFSRE